MVGRDGMYVFIIYYHFSAKFQILEQIQIM